MDLTIICDPPRLTVRFDLHMFYCFHFSKITEIEFINENSNEKLFYFLLFWWKLFHFRLQFSDVLFTTHTHSHTMH